MKKIGDEIYECPAFVDTHSHDDLAILTDPDRADKRNQGIGVQVIGNCGISPFPSLPGSCAAVRRLFDAVMGPQAEPFDSIESYRTRIGRSDIVVLQGYNALRASLFGPEPKKLDASERKQIAAAVGESIRHGAAGISLGLAYLPAVGSDLAELVEIARSTPLVTVHLRNESSGVLESVDEAAEIVRRARCRLHISHLKISGRPYWYKAEHLLRLVTRLHEEIGVTFDHYPYAYGCTGLSALLPPEIAALPPDQLSETRASEFARRYDDTDWENYVKMCGWDGLQLAALEKFSEYNGRSIASVGGDPVDWVLRLVREEPHPAMLIYSQYEPLITELLKLPFGCVGTDGLPQVRSHPRLTSSFPEYLNRCRSAGLSAQQAIAKASQLPRKIFNIPDLAGGTVRFNWPDGRILSMSPSANIEGNQKTVH